MRRSAKVLAGTIVLSTLMVGTAAAIDPVGTVERILGAVRGGGTSGATAVVVGEARATVVEAQDAAADGVTEAEGVAAAARGGAVGTADDARATANAAAATVRAVASGRPLSEKPRARVAVVGYVRILNHNLSVALPPNVAHSVETPRYVLFGALADPNQWSCSGSGDTSSYTVTCLPVTLPLNVSYLCSVLHADISTASRGASGRTTMDCNGDGAPEGVTKTVTNFGRHSVWSSSRVPVTAFVCTLDLAVPVSTAGCGDPGAARVE